MTAMSMPLLRVQSLGVSYSGAFSLSDIALELKAGHFLALIGPNGSGKSTLLRCLSGAFQKYSGSIEILSRELSTLPAKKVARMLALTLQDSPRPEHMTVQAYILLGRYPWLGYLGFYGSRDYSFASKSAALCHIKHLLARDLRSLSGGEWQKATLARALCQIQEAPCAILALDEISSAMDPARAMETFQLLSSLPASSRAIIAAIHDCNLAALFATHLLALKNGKVQFYGKIRDVFTKENLSDLYDMPLDIFMHPQLHLPQIYPLFPSAPHNHARTACPCRDGLFKTNYK